MNKPLPSKSSPYAFIIGLDSIQGLQSARLLSARKVPVVGFSTNTTFYSNKTRVCEKIYFTNTGGDELIELLLSIGPTLDEKAVLFPCQDKNVINLSANRDKLAPYYHLMLPEHKTVQMMSDKSTFYRFAQENGFPLPQTLILSSQKEAEEAAVSLKYPCIIKPPVRLSSWSKHTKLKGIISQTAEEFLANFKKFNQWSETLIVQELIIGKDRNHYTCNCYFDKNHEPLVVFSSRKLRQWRPQTGQACSSEEIEDSTVVEETVRLFKHVNYVGMGYLEMKKDDRDGKYYIIEPNIGRTTGRSGAAEIAGVEFLYTMYCDALNRPLPKNRTQQYRNVKWIHLLRDTQAAIYHVRRGELTMKEWWQSVKGPKAFAIFSWRDPSPFIAALMRAIPELLSPRANAS